MSQQPGPSDKAKLSGGAIATGGGVAVLALFVFQNTEDVTFNFLWFNFSWPLWLYTVFVAAFGALIWFGWGVMRRHRRRKARRSG